MFGMSYQFISIIINSCIFFIVLSTLVNSYLLLSSSSRLSLLSPILSITMFYIFIALSSDSGYNDVASISFWFLFFIFPLYLSLAKLTAINVNVDTGNAIARYWRATTIAETMLWTYENIWKRPIVWTGFISISFVFKLFALPHCIR